VSSGPAIGRFAPSPSGPLHLGSLVTALASYLEAKRKGGQWLVRIEDIDEPRCQKHWASAILETLEAHALHWDGPVWVQSQRKEVYQHYFSQLQQSELVYRCFCSRKMLESSAISQITGELLYPRTCLARSALNSPLQPLLQHSWRVRTLNEKAGVISFEDKRMGWQHQDVENEVGDFILKRADGYFAYHFVVVIDDAQQCVTEIVRGSDLLSATARQIFLQRVFGFGMPTYLHLPLVLNQEGQKLSKQTRANN
jgi:glutamyl-Q tRNA(Asp) synthetase